MPPPNLQNQQDSQSQTEVQQITRESHLTDRGRRQQQDHRSRGDRYHERGR